jgi:NAD(P)-dependent dehydrogenase (short-subunit alcohol dehydrogenase family)
MAVDLGPKGIRVNEVAPGYIYTDRWDKLDDATAKRRRLNTPIGKEATADDIAQAVAFLASDASKNIAGERLVVDAGCSAQHMPIDVDF